MNFSTLTLNERERLAYAEGYTETAALLAEMSDLERRADALENELGDTQDRLQDVESNYHSLIDERDDLEADLDNVRDERDAALSALDPLGCQLHDTRAELELARDQVKGLRSALMAIESKVPPHIRQFIREVLA